MFLKQHLNLFWQVEEIREMVDNDLGFQQAPLMCYSRTKTLLFISNDKKVIGCLIAEHIQWVSDWIGKRQSVSVLSDSLCQTFWNYSITSDLNSRHLANKYSMYDFSREEIKVFWRYTILKCSCLLLYSWHWAEIHVLCLTWLRPTHLNTFYSWRMEFFYLGCSYVSSGSLLLVDKQIQLPAWQNTSG